MEAPFFPLPRFISLRATASRERDSSLLRPTVMNVEKIFSVRYRGLFHRAERLGKRARYVIEIRLYKSLDIAFSEHFGQVLSARDKRFAAASALERYGKAFFSVALAPLMLAVK